MSIPQLFLVKRLYVEATSCAERGDEFSSGLAISLLQDAVELYVWALIKHQNIVVKEQSGFVANLEALQKAGHSMPGHAKLLELNKLRVSFKHYGILPAAKEASKYQLYVADCLRDAMSVHFQIQFESVSLVDLVATTEIRELLRAAEIEIEAKAYREAVIELAKAKALTFDLMQRYLPKIDRTLRDGDQYLVPVDRRKPPRVFAQLYSHLEAMREATLVAMFDVPMKDRIILRVVLPTAWRPGPQGRWSVNLERSTYKAKDCERALHSLIDLNRKLQERA